MTSPEQAPKANVEEAVARVREDLAGTPRADTALFWADLALILADREEARRERDTAQAHQRQAYDVANSLSASLILAESALAKLREEVVFEFDRLSLPPSHVHFGIRADCADELDARREHARDLTDRFRTRLNAELAGSGEG